MVSQNKMDCIEERKKERQKETQQNCVTMGLTLI